MTSVPPKTWGYYAARVYELEQRKGHRVFDRARFEESVAVDGLRRLSDQAAGWFAQFQLDERRLAECLVDGHAPRYTQRRK